VPSVFADENGRASPSGIECLDTATRFDESLLIEYSVGREEDFAMDMTNTGISPAEGCIEAGVVEAVPVDLVKTQGHVNRIAPSLLVLPAEILEQLIGGDSQIPYAALNEVPRECGFGSHHKVRRLGPASDLPEERPESAEILVVRPFMRPYLGYGEAEHPLKVRGGR
jgi:hypothetical protein